MKKGQFRVFSSQYATDFIGLSHWAAAEPESDFGLIPKRPSLKEDSTMISGSWVYVRPADVGFRPMWRVE